MSRSSLGTALALALVSACGGGFSSLAPREQNQFNRCRTYVLARRCTATDETVYAPHCESDLVDRYTAQPSEPARQQWLVRNGCPAEMVGTVSASGSEAASSDTNPVPASNATGAPQSTP
jgi:hypothetical protein